MTQHTPPHPSNPSPRSLLRWALLIAWVAGITIFSGRQRPLGALGDSSYGGLMNRAAHVGEYAGLALLLRWALDGARRNPRTPWISLALTLSYAVVDEAHQHFVAGRTFALADLAYDAAGAVGALGLDQLFHGLSLYARRRARSAGADDTP